MAWPSAFACVLCVQDPADARAIWEEAREGGTGPRVVMGGGALRVAWASGEQQRTSVGGGGGESGGGGGGRLDDVMAMSATERAARAAAAAMAYRTAQMMHQHQHHAYHGSGGELDDVGDEAAGDVDVGENGQHTTRMSASVQENQQLAMGSGAIQPSDNYPVLSYGDL